MSLAEATSARLKSPQPKIGENASVTSSVIGTNAESDFSFTFLGFAFFSRDFPLVPVTRMKPNRNDNVVSAT